MRFSSRKPSRSIRRDFDNEEESLTPGFNLAHDARKIGHVAYYVSNDGGRCVQTVLPLSSSLLVLHEVVHQVAEFDTNVLDLGLDGIDFGADAISTACFVQGHLE